MIAPLDPIEIRLESQALTLPAAVRARLAERLISSLDEDAEVDAAWRAEVERRADTAAAGAMTIALDEVLAELDRITA